MTTTTTTRHYEGDSMAGVGFLMMVCLWTALLIAGPTNINMLEANKITQGMNLNYTINFPGAVDSPLDQPQESLVLPRASW